MGRGWRRAFCTAIPTERDTEKQRSSSGSSNQQEFGLFPSASNPNTPRLHSTALRCKTFPDKQSQDPKLQCNTKSPRPAKFGSNPSSPRSPFAILKNTLRLSRNGCGVCTQSVKTGQGMAIYTAECGHAFHFPCIASHVRKQGSLICPVCNVTWKDVPLLSFHKNNPDQAEIVEKAPISAARTAVAGSAPATPTGTNRVHFQDKRISSIKTATKCYNDDEPLLSPRFNPIPEAPEETEDSEEFQGFFVTANNPPPNKVVDPYGLNSKKMERNISVKLLPEAAVVSATRGYETYAVALRVKAPPASATILSPPTHRAPVDLVTVLDVSGSMTGAKLQMLKRAMRLVISSLSSADRLAIVAFSSSPQRLLPLKRMTSQGQKLARRVIDNLSCGQGTSVSEALRKAAKVLEDRREKNPVASIMLLSDGHDERVSGGTNKRQGTTHVSSTRFAHIEIPVHSSGYGFKTHMPAEDSFAKCVGGLLSVVVQDVRVQLGFAPGSAPAEIMAVYSCNSRPSLMNSDSVRLGDLYAEEERELLIELKVPTSALGSHHVMSVRCSYREPVSQELMYGRERALLIPRPHTVRSNDPRIERLRNVFIYTRAVAESQRLVDHGDFTSAHHLLASAKALVIQGSGSGSEYARELEAELAQVHWRKQLAAQVQAQAQALVDDSGEPLTPTSAWREAERLAKVAMIKKSLNRSVSDLHGFENARF